MPKQNKRCKICSTDRIEKNGKRELKNDYSEFCIECEKWAKQTKKEVEWEKELERRFWIDLDSIAPKIMFDDRTGLPDDIKSFISTLLAKERSKLLGELTEFMKEYGKKTVREAHPLFDEKRFDGDEIIEYTEGFNYIQGFFQALKEKWGIEE